MFPILQIGGLAIQVPGLLILLGIWLGLHTAERGAGRHGVPAETLYNLAFNAIIAAVVGARLAYAGLHLDAFIRSPLGLFSLRPELLDPLGGLAAGGLAFYIAVRRRSLDPGRVLDALTPLVAMLLIAIPVAHLAAGTGYGAPTELPWAVDVWGASRHPIQVYEILAATGIFAWFQYGPRIRNQTRISGVGFLNFLVISAAARVFLEAFRGDGLLIGPGFRLAQVAGWAIAAAGLAGLWALGRRAHEAVSE
ncbi:MAG TPA: prolipoprotein diacylglyceryl transferase family protein [Anaerolineales bacterium]|nr:prolipoprotein diacylglyceryl transferase family protein [Anaerolineales bacterium]